MEDIITYSIPEAHAKFLSGMTSLRLLHDDVKEGRIEVVRKGRRVGVTGKAIKEYIERYTRPVTDIEAKARELLERAR